jgi:hypothetical protein
MANVIGKWFATACAAARLRYYGNGQRPRGAFPEGRYMVTTKEYDDATALLAKTLSEVPAVDFAPGRDVQRMYDQVCRSLGSTSFPTRAKRAFVFAGWDGDALEARGGIGHATSTSGLREANRHLCDGDSSPLPRSHRRIFPHPLCGQGLRAHARLRIPQELRRDSGVRGVFEEAPQLCSQRPGSRFLRSGSQANRARARGLPGGCAADQSRLPSWRSWYAAAAMPCLIKPPRMRCSCLRSPRSQALR